MPRGKFIVLEGGEGAGKSTIASFLKRSLSIDALVTRAGGSSFGEELRALFLSDKAARSAAESRFALAFAAQADHVHTVVHPALVSGKHVISDRLDASILAYQVYGEERPSLVPLFWSAREALLGTSPPDLYIFLDVSTKEGFERARKEGRTFDHFERRPKDFHERVREGYDAFLKQVPHIVVDANRPIEAVQKDVLDIIMKQL